MTIQTRQDIEGCLKRGMSVPQIATKVGKSPQAITAELKTRRILVKGTSFDGLDQDDANEVTLDPYVLGKRFKRHAERIILRKNGVTK